MKELIESYPNIFSTFVKNELKQITAKEEHVDYKKFSQEIFFMTSIFYEDMTLLTGF